MVLFADKEVLPAAEGENTKRNWQVLGDEIPHIEACKVLYSAVCLYFISLVLRRQNLSGGTLSLPS